MSEAVADLRFKALESIFTGTTGVVETENCVIRGVSVITGGVEAEGHNLQVDDTTLKQLQSCAKERGKVPVNLDHGTGVKDLNGYLTSFRMDGNKLRADWHLLKTHDETSKMLERAEVMPDCFGLSVAFKGPPKGVPIGGGTMAARCEKLLSVDCVTRPAANEGLFSVPSVDKDKKVMADENVQTTEEPTLAQLMQAIGEIKQAQEQQAQFNQDVINHLNGAGENNEPTIEDLANMNEEELAQLGLTPDDVQAALDELAANGDLETETEPNPAQTETTTSASNGVESSTANSSVGAELSALKREVISLRKKEQVRELQAKNKEEEIQFAEIENKIANVVEQRDHAIELAEKLTAKCEALQLAIKTGTRPVIAGVDTGIRMFGANDNGELHEFQVRVKQLTDSGKSQGEAIRFAQKENPAAHADWLQSLKKK